MKQIMDYISTNYIWFLVGIIIILLAIIGRYADKTNFGQEKFVKNKKADDDSNKDVIKQKENKKHDNTSNKNKEHDIKQETESKVENQTVEEIKQDDVKKDDDFDKKFDELDKEIDEVLPEKSVIDGELLDEIDSLSLDKTQKIRLEEIPDLDDVELPRIKKFSPDTDDDIWKL